MYQRTAKRADAYGPIAVCLHNLFCAASSYVGFKLKRMFKVCHKYMQTDIYRFLWVPKWSLWSLAQNGNTVIQNVNAFKMFMWRHQQKKNIPFFYINIFFNFYLFVTPILVFIWSGLVMHQLNFKATGLYDYFKFKYLSWLKDF